jgi:hypothetical protein
MRNWTAVLIATVILGTGCSRSEPRESSVGTSDPEIAVRVQVWDETTSRAPGDSAEVWLQGTGSWFPNLGEGGDVKVLGKRLVDVDQELFIYPDGREGQEISAPFRLTREMCPDGCARDSFLISIYDDRVEVVAEALTGGPSRTFDR